MLMLAVLLAPLNGPANQTIWVNPEEIVSVREPRAAHDRSFGPETRCVLQMADGKFIAVVDACDAVRAKIGVIR